MIGIYKITNKINGHAYIGQSTNIYRRWKRHQNYEIEDAHYPLYKAFQKYGLENFNFEVIEECSVEQLNEKEIYWISFYDTFKNGYNQTAGGQGPRCMGNKLTIYDVEEIEWYLINSSISQSEIAKMFNVSTEIIQGINTGRYWARPEKKYPLHNYQNDKKHNYCICCGAEITLKATYCKTCAMKNSRVVERPDAITLAQEIINSSFLAVGRKYGVTDNAIRKWCKAYDMPIKKNEIKEWLLEQ